MSEHKETSVIYITKEHFAHLKEDSGFGEHIVKYLSSELSERIMSILEQEKEIVVRESDVCVSEFMPTNSVEYRRQVNWSPLVRCKDCKHYDTHDHRCKVWNHGVIVMGFCYKGEREEDDYNRP